MVYRLFGWIKGRKDAVGGREGREQREENRKDSGGVKRVK